MSDLDRELLDRAKARRKALEVLDEVAAGGLGPVADAVRPPIVTSRPSVLADLAAAARRIDGELAAAGWSAAAVEAGRALPWTDGVREAADFLAHVGRELNTGKALREDFDFALHRYETAWSEAIRAARPRKGP